MLAVVLSLTTLAPARSSAQDLERRIARDTIRRDVRTSSDAALWETRAALLGAALVFDERIRSVVQANRSSSLDRLAPEADVIGTAGHIVPALIATYAGAFVLGKRSIANATLRIGLSYLAADAVESSLKPMIGRVRPYVGREPLTFNPLTTNGNFHSLPSAHVVHVASLGTAIAEETGKRWVRVAATVAVAYVGMQRVYRDQHWTSDVVVSDLLGDDIAHRTMQWLHAWHR